MKKNISLITSGFLIVTSLTSHASENEPFNEGAYITGGLGYYFFDSDRNLDDDAQGSLSLGYQFSSPWAVELLYLMSDADTDFGGSVDVSQWRVDALYHLNQHEKWQPYVAVGAGVMETEFSSIDTDESIVNAGGGINYRFNPNFSLRSDLRLINSLDNEFNDIALTVGLSYLFGKKSPQPVSVQAAPKAIDSDNDGIEDSLDNCPNTSPGVVVDNKGCALDNDSDKDGVANSDDKCPNTSAGAKVDAQGCYQVLKQTKEVQLSVNFANNSDAVPESDYPEIEAIAKFMVEFPQTNVVIEGHTDDRGNANYNQQLSERRAKAVAQILVNQFSVDSSRVSAVGYGEQRPLVGNDTAAQRAQNRRVVAVVKAVQSVRQ